MGKNIGVVLALKNQFSPQIKKIAEDLGKTEKEVKKATGDIKKFQRQCGDMAKTAVVGFGALAAAAGASMWTMATKTVETGDRIDELSQSLGMSRTGFQEWEYVLNQSSVEMEDLKVGMKTLTRQMMDSGKKGSEASKIFKKLGVSAKDNHGHFRKQEEVFNDVMNALQKMPEGIQKAAYAQKLFGKSGQAMLPALNSQAQAIDEVKDRARKLGIILGDDVINSAAKMDDTMKDVERTFGAIGSSLGAELLPAIQSLGVALVANMPQIKAVATDVFGALSGSIKFVIDNINWLVPIATGLLTSLLAFKTITGVITVFSTLKNVIGATATLQGVLNSLWMASPIGMVTVAIGALVAIGVALYMNWDKVCNVLGRAWDLFKKLGKAAFNMTPIGMAVNAVKGAQKKQVPKHALGTSYFGGGKTLVNEGGRGEEIDLPSGAKIIPHDVASKQGKSVVVYLGGIHIAGNIIGDKDYAHYLANIILGGVQTSLARG